MNNNTFWACFWACFAAVAITLIVSVHLSDINTTKVKLEELKVAVAAGLQQQQLIGHGIIWVKVKE